MDSNAISRLTDPVFIRGLLERHGFRFSKALGQNFLTDASVPALSFRWNWTDGSNPF